MRGMKLNRRGFFGFAAASPLAVSGVAKEVEKMGLDYASRAEIGAGSYGLKQQYADAMCATSGPEGDWLGRRIIELRKEIANLARPDIRHRNITRLDPDLTASRSFSLAGRLNIQRDREIERAYHENKSYLQRELESLLTNNKSKF